MYNFQRRFTTSLRKARYLEKGSEYKTHRKDAQPHRKACDCKVCNAYREALRPLITPEAFSKRFDS